MSSSPTPPDDDPHAADLPLTMAASGILDQLPQDAQKALEHAGELAQAKVSCSKLAIPHPIRKNEKLQFKSYCLHLLPHSLTPILTITSPTLPTKLPLTPPITVTILFRPLPSTPRLRTDKFKISSTQRFEAVVRFLRRKLALQEHESVFCYVNSVFAPALDEGVGNLWRCFKTGDELVVSYSITPAYG
ncbi:Ubiquitin-like protein [Elasticomyces elasticus]|nr:Ubiquitin-like protein [Elasticomyces elasticus]